MTEENKSPAETAEEKKESQEEQKEAPGEAKEEVKEEVKEEAPKEEEKKEEKKEEEKEVEVPDEYKDIIEKVEKMTVMELNALVKVLEKKFGVSAQAVAATGPATGGEAQEEQSTFKVELTSAGDSKINVIKAVKATLGLGLKEAKDLVESAPAVLKEGVKKEEAEEMKKVIEEAGGSVELK